RPSFRELLGRVRAVALGAYAHQELPFEMLVEQLQPTRDLGRNPLFQVTFQLLNVPGAGPGTNRGPGAASQLPFELQRSTSILDLAFNLVETADGASGIVEYDAQLFDASTIDRLIAHYQTLLQHVSSEPDRPLAQHRILGRSELDRLLVTWNATDTTRPPEGCVHELFAAQAARTPDVVAVVQGDRRLSYGELDRRANQLAHHLGRLGVGRGALVALWMERSPELVVALLGVLKAGAAYVPLDRTSPPARVRFMLADTQARVILTQASLAASLPEHRAAVLALDRDWPAIAAEPDHAPVSAATCDDAAYVIYTSGSTGTPKGVVVPHRGLVNYLTWCVAAYDVAAGRGAPVHSPISFDLTITSLFAPLLVGRTTELADERDDVEALAQLLRRQGGFSLVKITPAHLDLLARQLLPAEAADRARVLVIGGEALLREHVTFWQANAPDTRLVNEYGPTETVVGCCVHEVPPDGPATRAVPIGRPIANTRLYVLDRRMQPVPIGVHGELYVGGAGVAHGYLNQPGLTAERFVPDPFATRPGARLYRTGDLARYLADGTLEYLGRVDDQIKIRGHRIELGEIEAALGQHPAVREAAVLVREDPVRGRELVAYVDADGEPAPTAQELRTFLASVVPGYMIPSAWVYPPSWPLTANGKVDRHALAALDAATSSAPTDVFVEPRTETERLLAGIWREVLGVTRVGVHDDFFALGGHSLLATQLVARIQHALGVELPVRSVFEAPTIDVLARAVEARASMAEAEPTLEPILRATPDGVPQPPLPLEQLSDAEIDRLLREELETLTQARPESRPNGESHD
ncbi:MAG TPA: amino acid adenylation domain-containing protein, partial [Gemmatimonadaceae bacterium]|nr:amino acid adenylation domain-containing protein [Gemmatimonadaceae bacterium]